MATVKVDDDTFEAKVLGADRPVLVDFWPSGAAPASRSPPRSTRSARSWPTS